MGRPKTMGRPKKQTVDYFPHFVSGSKRTISILEARWGNDGYAFWFKLLELLCITDGHAFNMTTVANQEYLYSYTKTEPDTAEKIIEMLVDLDNIDTTLWNEHKIIWCQSLVDNLKPVYDKRTSQMPKKPFSEENIPENSTEKGEKEIPAPNTGQEKPKTKKSAPKKATKPKDEPEKIKYAEFVKMTEEEYEKLVNQYGKDMTLRMITVLDNYKGQNGKTYKSDYRAILNWVVDRVQEEIKKNGGNGYGRNEIPTGNNGATNPGGFKPSGGFRNG